MRNAREVRGIKHVLSLVWLCFGLPVTKSEDKGRLSNEYYSPRCCIAADCLSVHGGLKHAVVTSLRSPEYMVSLRDMQCSLRRTNPELPLVVLAVADELAADVIFEIQEFAEYREVPNIEYSNSMAQ